MPIALLHPRLNIVLAVTLAWLFTIAPTARSQQLPALPPAGVQSQPLDVGRWDPAVPLEGARDPSEEPSAPPVVVAENDAFTYGDLVWLR